jgi:type II secretory pathway pseudopilin PulG
MVEVVAALVLLSMILSSVMVLMNRYVDSVIDLELRQEAFELARGNMEQLLAESKLSDMAEFGDSEQNPEKQNPEIEWQTLVEPFYEPVTDQMWIRAVCSAGFDDSKGEYESIELEHWITNLTAAQIKQILAQQELESEWMDLLKSGEYSDIQETTIYCLEQQSLDVKAYKDFLEEQRREKLKYLDENGMDGWEDVLQQLEAEENEFLVYEIGMDFDQYNDCAANYVPLNTGLLDYGDAGDSGGSDQGQSKKTNSPEFDEYGIDWSRIPPELIPILEQLLGTTRPE